MPEFYFSEEFKEKARHYYNVERPCIIREQISVEKENSPLVEIVDCKCTACGFSIMPNPNVTPIDQIRCYVYKHAYDMQFRKTYCGGQMEFVTRPYLHLIKSN